MKNYYVGEYLHLGRKLRNCNTISDCIFLAESIGFVLGQLYSTETNRETVKRISTKFSKLKDDVLYRSFEIYNEN